MEESGKENNLFQKSGVITLKMARDTVINGGQTFNPKLQLECMVNLSTYVIKRI